MKIFKKKHKVFDCDVDCCRGTAWLDGEELFDVIRCCPDEHWAEIMLRDSTGSIMLNKARDAVIVVRVVGKHITFKLDEAKTKYYQDLTMPKDWPNKGN